MLIVTRRKNEWLSIGGIGIKVVRTGREVVLGIIAPRDQPVVRHDTFLEFFRYKNPEKQAAPPGARQGSIDPAAESREDRA